jgi:hypothetical protein
MELLIKYSKLFKYRSDINYLNNYEPFIIKMLDKDYFIDNLKLNGKKKIR